MIAFFAILEIKTGGKISERNNNLRGIGFGW